MNSPDGCLNDKHPVHYFLQTVNRSAMIFQRITQKNKARAFLLMCVFITAVCPHSFSQPQHVIDSLMINLRAQIQDTNKLRVLNELINGKWTSPDSNSKDYAVNALALAEKMGFPEGRAYANYHIGLNYDYKGNYAEALKYYQEALRISKESGDKKATSVFFISIAYMNYHMGKYTEALENYAIAKKLTEEIGHKQLMGDCYNLMGHTYRNMGNYTEALECHLNALRIGEETWNKAMIGKSRDGMGLVYLPLGKYSEALKSFQLGMKIWQEVANKGEIAGSYNRLGRVYTKLGNYTEALNNCQAALNFFKEKGDKYSTAVSYNNMGDIYHLQSNYQEALKNYQAGLNINKEVSDKYRLALSYLNVGKVYTGLNNWREAKQYLLNALLISKENGDKENIKNAYENLSVVDSAMGNYLQAFTYHKLYSDYKDSVLNEANNRQNTQLMEQYESDKKDKAIELLNKENAIQQLRLNKQTQAKNYFIAGLILFAVLSFFIYRNYHARQKLKMLSLRNKIASDLHDDIGSTLSSISIFSQMAQTQSKENIPLLETIGENSRKMLDAMADIVWTINPENDQFEKIILRMKSFAYELLGAKKIDFEFEANEDVEKLKLPMEVRKNLYLIFKEATNNLVKYAGADKAKFIISGEKNNLRMTIHDNGKGFDVGHSTAGNGLKNMKKRAEEIGGLLKIDSHPGNGTMIELNVYV
jgi:signal transduction histidine kinase